MEDKFGEMGVLDRVIIVRNPYTKESRGFGFINFKVPEQAQAALQKFNNQDLFGTQMKIELAKRTEPRKKTPGKFMGTGREGDERGGRDNRGRDNRDSRPGYGPRYGRPGDRDYERPRR